MTRDERGFHRVIRRGNGKNTKTDASGARHASDLNMRDVVGDLLGEADRRLLQTERELALRPVDDKIIQIRMGFSVGAVIAGAEPEPVGGVVVDDEIRSPE